MGLDHSDCTRHSLLGIPIGVHVGESSHRRKVDPAASVILEQHFRTHHGRFRLRLAIHYDSQEQR